MMATQSSAGSGKGARAQEREAYRYAASSYRERPNEAELFELVELSEVPLDKELFKVILELLKLNVAPATILQVLKTLRSRATQSSLPPSLHGSRSHSPTGTAATQEDALTTPSDQPDAVLPDSDHHRVTQGGLDQGMTPLDQAHVPVAEQPRRQAREGKTSASTRSSHSSTKPSSAAKHSARSSRSTKPKTSHQKQPRS